MQAKNGRRSAKGKAPATPKTRPRVGKTPGPKRIRRPPPAQEPGLGNSRARPSGRGFISKPFVASNDELIEAFTTSTSFTATALEVNPGLPTTFPWLSRIARNYEKYRFMELEFYYKPRVSGFAAAGQEGAVMLGFDYDSADPVPITETNMSTRESYAESPAYQVCRLRPSMKDLNNSPARFIRTSANTPGTDIKTYDVGQLFVGSTGFSGVTNPGQLRVRYTCMLSSAVLEDAQLIPASRTLAALFATASTVLPNNIGTETQLVFDEVEYNGIGLGLLDGGATIVPPPGNYAVDLNIDVQNLTASTTDPSTVEVSLYVDGIEVDVTGFSVVGPCASKVPISWIARVDGSQDIHVGARAAFTGGAVSVSPTVRFIACA